MKSVASKAVHAELIGSETCTAHGIAVAEVNSPILELCRKLIAAGIDPATRLHAYRGATLRLRIRSIGAAAGLEISGEGTGFRPRRAPDAAPPVRQNGRGGL